HREGPQPYHGDGDQEQFAPVDVRVPLVHRGERGDVGEGQREHRVLDHDEAQERFGAPRLRGRVRTHDPVGGGHHARLPRNVSRSASRPAAGSGPVATVSGVPASSGGVRCAVKTYASAPDGRASSRSTAPPSTVKGPAAAASSSRSRRAKSAGSASRTPGSSKPSPSPPCSNSTAQVSPAPASSSGVTPASAAAR